MVVHFVFPTKIKITVCLYSKCPFCFSQHQKQEEPSRTKTTVGPKKAFLKKGEGIARFGMKPKTDAVKPTALQEKNSKNNGMEQRAPVTRKTATAKDYATGKQPAVVAEASGVKQKAIVNHSATVKQSDRLQLDARKSNVSKFPTDRQTGGTVFPRKPNILDL